MRHDDLVAEVTDRYFDGEQCLFSEADCIDEIMKEYNLSVEKAMSVYSQASFLANYLMKV